MFCIFNMLICARTRLIVCLNISGKIFGKNFSEHFRFLTGVPRRLLTRRFFSQTRRQVLKFRKTFNSVFKRNCGLGFGVIGGLRFKVFKGAC